MDRARQMEEEGHKIIKLNIGNLAVFGFDAPEEIQQDMIRNLPNSAGYSDSKGIFGARKAVMHETQKQGIKGVTLDDIYLGNGASELIVMATNALLDNGDELLLPAPDYPLWTAAASLSGATPVHYVCNESEGWTPDLADIRAKITPKTKGIVVINPNNPTGTFLPAARIEGFLKQVPQQVVVVLDEAYNEYLDPALRFDSARWVREYPNLILSRTLSKVYGLAGLRVGFGLAQAELTDLMNRIRQPFNTNSMAQAAAIAAIADDDFVERSYQLNRDGLAKLQSGFAALGLQFVPSHGNFVLVRVGNAGAVYEGLLRQGVIVRPVGGYGLPEWLRVSVGLPEENDRLLAALAKVMSQAG